MGNYQSLGGVADEATNVWQIRMLLTKFLILWSMSRLCEVWSWTPMMRTILAGADAAVFQSHIRRDLASCPLQIPNPLSSDLLLPDVIFRRVYGQMQIIRILNRVLFFGEARLRCRNCIKNEDRTMIVIWLLPQSFSLEILEEVAEDSHNCASGSKDLLGDLLQPG